MTSQIWDEHVAAAYDNASADVNAPEVLQPVPDLQRLPVGALAQVFRVADDGVSFDTFDLARQHLVSHHFTIREGDASVFRSPHRYVWPSELDLMGELAGLRLTERWADWHRAAFTAESRSHVSVWEKPS